MQRTCGHGLVIRCALLTVLVIAVTTNCAKSSNDNELDETKVAFSGFVSAIYANPGNALIGHFVAESHADKLVHRLDVVVTEKTKIILKAGERQRVAQFGALQLKDRIKIWFKEDEKKSNRETKTAHQVLIER